MLICTEHLSLSHVIKADENAAQSRIGYQVAELKRWRRAQLDPDILRTGHQLLKERMENKCEDMMENLQ
jgi:hypothetical protein